MLQHIVATAPARVAGRLASPLQLMMRRVALNMVEFNAQDVYALCTVVHNMDTIGMLQDAEFMRGLSAAFKRSDQTVLSPFQTSVVTEVFAKANINVKANEVAVPEEEAVSPESLLGVLRAMKSNANRSEKDMHRVIILMTPLLGEFSPMQLAMTVKLLGMLQCPDTSFLTKVVKRACDIADDLGTLDIATLAVGAAYAKLNHATLRRIFELAAARSKDFGQEEYVQVLQALNAAGPKYAPHLALMVSEALEQVESMEATTLTHFLVCFASLQLRDPATVEIFADSLLEKVPELGERDTIHAMQAVHALGLMSQPFFTVFINHIQRFARIIDPRNLVLVMDVCSSVPFKAEALMDALLDRAADCVHVLSAFQMGDILEVIATYPPARNHRIVGLFGKKCKLRMDLLGPTPMAKAAQGLSMLGFPDTDFYLEASVAFHRWGYKDFSQLEPILIGLCITAAVEPKMVRILASYLGPMASSMSLPEVERGNRYMNRLSCDDDWVYRALADRVRVFVKEITPEMPSDLQLLLQRGARHQQQQQNAPPSAGAGDGGSGFGVDGGGGDHHH